MDRFCPNFAAVRYLGKYKHSKDIRVIYCSLRLASLMLHKSKKGEWYRSYIKLENFEMDSIPGYTIVLAELDERSLIAVKRI